MRRGTVDVMRAQRFRAATARLRFTASALNGPKTLDRKLPGLFMLAFVSLLIIQILLAL